MAATAGSLINGGVTYDGGLKFTDTNLTTGEYYIVYGSYLRVVIGSTAITPYVRVCQRRGTAWTTLLSYASTAGGTYNFAKGTTSTYYPVWLIYKYQSSLGNASVTGYSWSYGYSGYRVYSCQNGYVKTTSYPTASSYSGSYPSLYAGSPIAVAYDAFLTTYV